MSNDDQPSNVVSLRGEPIKSNVVELGVPTKADIPAEKVLNACLQEDYETVIVLAFKKTDKKFHWHSTTSDAALINWAADCMKYELMANPVPDEENEPDEPATA